MQILKLIDEVGFDKAVESLSLRVKEYPMGDPVFTKYMDTMNNFILRLVVLNYNQIESPKYDLASTECRSLILTEIIDLDSNTKAMKTKWVVVSRSFDRFFNYGEGNTRELVDGQELNYYYKDDGSLIKVYRLGGNWHVSTKGTAFGESLVGNSDRTFKELVWNFFAVNTQKQFNDIFDTVEVWHSDNNFTYIFELCHDLNRVVLKYKEPTMVLLAVRSNKGKYIGKKRLDYIRNYLVDKFNVTKRKPFTTKDILELPFTDELMEGFVGYNSSGEPIVKVKSDLYVKLHHLKGSVVTLKGLASLLISGEESEYLSYFPEEKDTLQKLKEKLDKMLDIVDTRFALISNIESQKEYALNVMKWSPELSGLLFDMRRYNISARESFNKLRENKKIDFILYANDTEHFGVLPD